MSPLETLVQAGTKLWVDSVDPTEIRTYHELGATGATSNPAIIADLINTGRFDDMIRGFIAQGMDDEAIAWAATNQLVQDAQALFVPVSEKTSQNDGWVSFELDPLLEDADCPLSPTERSAKYIELGKKWSAGHTNRMIKVPATEGGLGAVEELAAHGVALNITLIFSERQYTLARDAAWRGAQRHGDLKTFKSVYSIFVSRVDAYTDKTYPQLSGGAQGQVGIVNAKQIYALNKAFWQDKGCSLDQEMIFASTGTKKPEDPKDKYVAALAGDDIQTNPPSTNAAVQELGKAYGPELDNLPTQGVLDEIATQVDFAKLEADLMAEGLAKFAQPHKELIASIASKRQALVAG